MWRSSDPNKQKWSHTERDACQQLAPSRSLTVPRDPVELSRSLGVRMSFLAPDGEALSVPSSNVTPNVAQVRDVVPDLPTQFGVELDTP